MRHLSAEYRLYGLLQRQRLLPMIKLLAEGSLETKFGVFRERLYYDGKNHSIAISLGTLQNAEGALCRVHSRCISAHVFNSVECDCREQMAIAQGMIAKERCGVIIWLDQDGRGNGHMAKLLTSEMKRRGIGQSEAYEKLGYPHDNRSYRVAAQIINDLGITSVRVMTNNPDKKSGLSEWGVRVTGMVPVLIEEAGNDLLLSNMIDKAKGGHKIQVSD